MAEESIKSTVLLLHLDVMTTDGCVHPSIGPKLFSNAFGSENDVNDTGTVDQIVESNSYIMIGAAALKVTMLFFGAAA